VPVSLSAALNTTKSIFTTTSYQSSIVSTNIANSSTDYVRREASVTSSLNGAQEDALLKQYLRASESDSGQQRL